ncbi:hypothetical protein SAMN02927916_0917 [Flavobacterium anhuiense]|uniref:Uncharacterized protein n=1 Tax=Flavobacterium anhuiense TaxID=459526 RepID=A0ABY0LCK9_9FLAO|nr:hypothetical protein SAMN02927916_0917 [Flavobacterium anhuiense]
MDKYIEDYNVPPYLFQVLNILFGLLAIYILYRLYKHFTRK